MQILSIKRIKELQTINENAFIVKLDPIGHRRRKYEGWPFGPPGQ